MTSGRPSSRPTMADTLKSPELMLRQGGRDLIIALYTMLRSLKLYPVENTQVQRALDDLTAKAASLLAVEHEIEIRIAGDFVFVNSTRLRLGLDNYASFSHVLGVLRQCGIGVVRIGDAMERREWQVFVSQLLAYSHRAADPNKLAELQQKLAHGGVGHLTVEAATETEDEAEEIGRAPV